MRFIKGLLLALAVAAGLFAQPSGCVEAFNATPAAAGSPLYVGGMPFVVTLTDSIYFKAQPSDIQALLCMQPGASRDAEGQALAVAGYPIDVPIMVWGWDPTLTMAERWMYGYTWVPSALQPPIALPPGLTFPGLPTYNAKTIPAGAIKVSVNASDYPPYVITPPPSPTTNLVGPLLFGNVYTFGPGVKVVNNVVTGVANGKSYVQNGVSYTAHITSGLIGVTVYFTQP